MTTDTPPVDGRIRGELSHSVDPAQADVLWTRVEASLDRPVVRARRRRAVRPVAIALAAAVGITGIAVAADLPITTRILDSDDSPVTRIEAFSDPAAERATPVEYAEVIDLAGKVSKFELAERDLTRVVVDQSGVGRLIVFPYRDGTSICLVRRPETTAGVQPGVWTMSCGGQFDDTGLEIRHEADAGARPGGWATAIDGVASKDVDRIEVVLSDGRSEPVQLEQGAFWWRAEASADRIVAVRTYRGDVVTARGILCNHESVRRGFTPGDEASCARYDEGPTPPPA